MKTPKRMASTYQKMFHLSLPLQFSPLCLIFKYVNKSWVFWRRLKAMHDLGWNLHYTYKSTNKFCSNFFFLTIIKPNQGPYRVFSRARHPNRVTWNIFVARFDYSRLTICFSASFLKLKTDTTSLLSPKVLTRHKVKNLFFFSK